MKLSTMKKIFFAFAICTFTSVAAVAQFSTMPDNEDPDPVTETPIDGGAGILIAAGVAYGVKKYRDRKKFQSQNQK